MGLGISPADEDLLKAAYQDADGKFEDLPPEKFVSNIDWRIYTEWCMNGNGNHQNAHRSYVASKPIEDWITRETHFALGRLLKGGSQEVADALYRKMREKVVRAIAKRAMELFATWDKYQWPRNDDARNLRASLEPYIEEVVEPSSHE